MESSTYLQDLLSVKTDFSGGRPCDLRDDVPEEIVKLDANSFDYDSDSDLEDEEHSAVDSNPETPKELSVPEKDSARPREIASGVQDGRAFAINGTAYKTWRAFIFYAYTNELDFNPINSQKRPAKSTPVNCSPKSMYRFADYAGHQQLKNLAKEQIKNSLEKSNIVTELFSSFTYRYSEIIELETDFLVKNFTTEIGRELNNALQLKLSARPHYLRVVSFIMGRLLAGSAQVAWTMLDNPSDDARENLEEDCPAVWD